MRNVPETVHEYNIPRLNVIFVVTSLLLFGTVVWMVWRDYKREWKPYQHKATEFERIKLILDIHDAEQKADAGNLEELLKKKYDAQRILAAEKKKLSELREAATLARTNFEVATAEYQAQKAKVDQIVSEYDGIKELDPEDRRLSGKLKEIRKAQDRLLALQVALDAAKARNDASKASLDAETQVVADLDKQISQLEKDRQLAEKRLRLLSDPVLGLLDSPLIEFATPKTRVAQTITEDQTQDLNFTQVPRIDRCISCHVFAERKDGPQGEADLRFADLPQPWSAHPRLDLFVASDSPHPLQKFGCSTCHFGWDRGVGFVTAAHTPQFYPERKDYLYYKNINRWLQAKEYESVEQNYQTARETLDGWRQTLEEKRGKLAQEVAGKPARSPERIELARVRNDLAKLDSIIADVPPAEPADKAVKLATTQRELWHEKYQWHPMHHKEDPMRPGDFIESSCWKCHRQVTYIPQAPNPADPSAPSPGEKINAGIRLVEQAGCYACHPIQQLETTVKYKLRPNETLAAIANKFSVGSEAILAYNGISKPDELKPGREIVVPVRVPQDRPAPTLERISSKVTREWTERWLQDPKSFRRNTFMPRFWGLDNTRPGMKYMSQDGKQQFDWGERNSAEIRAVTDYLFSISEQVQYPAPPAGNAENGKKLVAEVGCYGCHVENEPWSQLAPKDRRFRTQGPMLTGGGSKYNGGWLYAWLKDPQQYHPGTRMPNLRLSDQEAADITAYLLQDKNPEFEAKALPELNAAVLEDMVVDYKLGSMPLVEAQKEAKAMPQEEQLKFAGEKLVRRYGCYSCHLVKGLEREKPVSVDLSDWASKKITQFDFGFIHMEKNHYAWLHQKVSNPRSFDRVAGKRPQEYLKMPQYDFNEEQISLVMTAIMGLTSEKPEPTTVAHLDDAQWQIENGRWLMKEFNCAGCHTIEGRGGAINSKIEKEFMRPPILAGQGIRVRPDWMYHFIQNPGENKYRYWLEARMPTFPFNDTQINTLVRYFALVDKQPYPFEEATMDGFKPEASLIQPGQNLFLKFQCLSCHAVVTPEKARENGKAAPDLRRVKERMRPAGIIPWLANPGDTSRPHPVTPGFTLMPPNWPEAGQPNPFPDILNGDTDLQIRAVRDYLMTYQGPP